MIDLLLSCFASHFLWCWIIIKFGISWCFPCSPMDNPRPRPPTPPKELHSALQAKKENNYLFNQKSRGGVGWGGVVVLDDCGWSVTMWSWDSPSGFLQGGLGSSMINAISHKWNNTFMCGSSYVSKVVHWFPPVGVSKFKVEEAVRGKLEWWDRMTAS